MEMMRNKIRKTKRRISADRVRVAVAAFACLLCMFVSAGPRTAYADDPAVRASITSNTSITQGNSFTATFTVTSSGDSLGVVFGTITYDPAILSCEGYAGMISIPMELVGMQEELNTYTVSYSFTAIAAGSSSLSVEFGG